MKGYFEGWRRYLREGETTKWVPGTKPGQWIRSGPMLDKASEKKMISGRGAQEQGISIVDFDPGPARDVAQRLADKLGAQLGKELARGSMGIVYEIRTDGGEGIDMILKVTQFPHEKKGYTLARWKKRELEKNPELASILPEVGKIEDIIYDFKEGWLKGRSIKIYGIPIERLVALPPRIKEQMFGHGGGFKSEEAEKEWIRDVTNPELLIPVLRETFSDPVLPPKERYYPYFDGGMQAGIEFEKEVLDLEPPQDFEDYGRRWIPQIRRRAVKRAKKVTTYSSVRPTPDRIIDMQAAKLAKRLENRIKIPQYPPEALKHFGVEGAYPKGGENPQVADFFNKLMKLKDHGVDFWDTHSENIMMRPSTKEIVVSDVGLFRQPEEN
jgi:hypothetical protein